MSIARCDLCQDNFIDTDEHPEAYVERRNPPPDDLKWGITTICLCAWCQDTHVDEDGFYIEPGEHHV